MGKVWNSKVGHRDRTTEEEAARLIDDVRALDEAREARKSEFRAAAREGIKGVLGTTKEGDDLLVYQLNLATHAQQLQRKEAKGTITGPEQTELDALDAARDVIEAWRSAENAASALLDAAGINDQLTHAARLAEINAVTPTWPS